MNLIAIKRCTCAGSSVGSLFLVGLLWWASVPAQAETGINAYFAPGEEIKDAVGARYRFKIVQNESPEIMIILGWNRFYGPSNETYLLESNLYADGLSYSDGLCTTRPLSGTSHPAAGSLRTAVPDYNKHGWTGARTLSLVMFPRQIYLIDGIPNVGKTDMISETNLNSVECAVEIT